MPLVVDNTYQLTLNGSCLGHNYANVFHFELLGVDPPTILEATQIFYDEYADAFAPQMMDEWIYNSVSYVDLSSTTGDSGTTVPSGSHHGTGTGEGAPPAVCALITWTATGGRSQRNGRTYLPGLDESSVTNSGVISAGVADAITAHATDFRNAMDAAGLSLGIVSKTSASTGTIRTVTGEICQSQVATQRRRNRS